MPREDGSYYTLVECNLGRRSVLTEDGLCYSIDCMKRIKGFYSLCLGKTGRAAS
jgi:hypothetical protein